MHNGSVMHFRAHHARLAYTDARWYGHVVSYLFVPLAFLACLAAVLIMPFWASVFVCVLLLLFAFAALTPTARAPHR